MDEKTLRFQGYCSETGIALFACPFNKNSQLIKLNFVAKSMFLFLGRTHGRF